MRPEFFQQVIEMCQSVSLVAMDHQILFPVGGGVNHLMRHHHAAKTHPDELVDEFVMVAGDVDDLCVFAALAEQFLDQDVILIAPEPAKLQFPAVNEIADDIEVFAVHYPQKFQQLPDAGMPRPQMDV